MLHDFVPAIESLRSEGAVVLLKWDGERTHQRCTVVVTRQATDYVFREDSDDIEASLTRALADYRVRHPAHVLKRIAERRPQAGRLPPPARLYLSPVVMSSSIWRSSTTDTATFCAAPRRKAICTAIPGTRRPRMPRRSRASVLASGMTSGRQWSSNPIRRQPERQARSSLRPDVAAPPGPSASARSYPAA
jgi:hypothetical protein